MTSKLRICIVGAGLAGLALAATITGDDVDATIFERRDAVEALGGGIILQPNAARALQEVGCFDEVCRAGTELTHLVQHRDGERVEISQHEVWPRLRLPTVAVHRHILHAILLDRAKAQAAVELSRQVVDLAEGHDRAVAVRTDDGSAPEFDLVVGADGVQSVIRAHAAPRSEIRELGLWWARWIVDAGSDLPREWYTERLRRVGLGAFPLGQDEVQVFATIPQEDMTDGRQERTLEAITRSAVVLRHATRHGCRLVHVGAAREVHPHVWGAHRVALAGDAAHAMSPTLSAGGGLAIEDGVLLGRLLNGAQPVDSIVSRYAELRRPRLAWMAKVGRMQIRLSQGTPPDAGRTELASHLRRMYAPLDEPDYFPLALSGAEPGQAKTTRR